MIGFVLFLIMWVFSFVMVIVDEPNRMSWLIIMWIMIIGMRIELKK